MISVADFLSGSPQALAPLAPSASETTPSGWFDECRVPSVFISADPAAAARGLSVAQHADRVLGLLCRLPDEG